MSNAIGSAASSRLRDSERVVSRRATQTNARATNGFERTVPRPQGRGRPLGCARGTVLSFPSVRPFVALVASGPLDGTSSDSRSYLHVYLLPPARIRFE